MKQRLLLFITLFSFLASNAQVNPPRNDHYLVPCATGLTDSACNLIANPGFRSTGDSLEDFSDGDVIMWQDINNLTTDINGALAINMGWNLPTVPSGLTGVNFASMLVDNRHALTEGIAGRTLPIEGGKKYALSFFLASSYLSSYRPSGFYTFKIFLTNCQNFDTTSSGNPEIIGGSQLIFCQSFGLMGDSDWQQYLVSFTADDDYNMIVIYPEISSGSFNGGTYVHFLYPELIPINPTNHYSTYIVPGWTDTTDINNPVVHPDSTKGITSLSACGVINASYQWEGPNGIVSNQATDGLVFSNSIGENDVYTFSMWVDSAFGNDPVLCWDAESPIITETSTQLATMSRVSCADNVTVTGCNIIPNATFVLTDPNTPPDPIPNASAFSKDYIQFWSSVNSNGTPDINGAIIGVPPPYPTNVPLTTNVAGMIINTTNIGYTYEGIYAKIPHLTAGRRYAFSCFLNIVKAADIDNPPIPPPGADFTFSVVLGRCPQTFLTNPTVNSVPPNFLGTPLNILCQNFPGIVTTGWQQYLVTFVANDNYDLIVVYPQGNLNQTGSGYVHFLMPELIDVTNLISYTQNSACSYTLQACGVTNASFKWFDGDNNVIGTTNPITVDATVNPPLYTLELKVPGITTNPILSNTCGTNTGIIDALAFGKKATWVGGSGSTIATRTDWSIAANWNPAVVPNDALTDVFIPTGATNQPTIMSGTFQVNSINIESGGLLTNKGTLQIARNIAGNSGSISNYNGSVITGSIEMNGTCKGQTIAGNIFVGNDVKNFTVLNNVTISSTSGQGLDVYGQLSFCFDNDCTTSATNKTLMTSDNLTLVSTATTTANVAKIDATNFIDGEVTVERYINTGTGAVTNDHAAKWQILATPTGANSIGQTVKQSWMENGLVTSTANGYGTNIPDPRSTWFSLGFDQLATNGNTAIKTYNSGTSTFNPIANTGIPLYNKNGYFLFVRGDRSATTFFGFAIPTNLRSKGALFQPHTAYTPPNITVPATTSSTSPKFEMIGNPYASPISIDYMKNNNFTNLTNDVIVWDPLLAGSQGLGGYQTLHASTGYKPTPGGTALYDANTAYPDIQSGQAFFVGTPPNSITGLVTFEEAVKSTNHRLVTRQVANVTNQRKFKANLYYGENLCDGNAIIFEYGFKNHIDADDAGKFLNPGENFMINRSGNILSVETRQPVLQSDTIFYEFSNLLQATYKLKFSVENLENDELQATLIDNYLNKITPLNLSDSSFFEFIVDGNKASFMNRFMVVFKKNKRNLTTNTILNPSIHEIRVGKININPNPVKGKTINIHYSNIAAGKYSLQLINYAGQIIYSGQIDIKENEGLLTIKPSGGIVSGSYQVIFIAQNGKKYRKSFISNN